MIQLSKFLCAKRMMIFHYRFCFHERFHFRLILSAENGDGAQDPPIGVVEFAQ